MSDYTIIAVGLMIRDCRLIVTMDSQYYLKLLYKSTG